VRSWAKLICRLLDKGHRYTDVVQVYTLRQLMLFAQATGELQAEQVSGQLMAGGAAETEAGAQAAMAAAIQAAGM
jgi:hypothetical protein